MDDSKKRKRHIPPVVHADRPASELEEQLRRDPDNLDKKVDVGSDESMDASDPISIVRPGQGEPVPSSGSPEEEEDEEEEEGTSDKDA